MFGPAGALVVQPELGRFQTLNRHRGAEERRGHLLAAARAAALDQAGEDALRGCRPVWPGAKPTPMPRRAGREQEVAAPGREAPFGPHQTKMLDGLHRPATSAGSHNVMAGT